MPRARLYALVSRVRSYSTMQKSEAMLTPYLITFLSKRMYVFVRFINVTCKKKKKLKLITRKTYNAEFKGL